MNIKTLSLDLHSNSSGHLIALESLKNIPFEIKRLYYIFGSKPEARRGFHAHKKLKQVAICVKGSCKFMLDDGTDTCEVELNAPYVGLYFEGLIWREMFDFSPDCVLLILADDYYNEEDYIRDYDTFLEAAQK